MRGAGALGLAVVVGGLGLATRNGALETVALALGCLVALALVYRALLTGVVRGKRQALATIVPWGGALTEKLTLANASWLPVPWARVVDASDLPGHPHGYVASLPGRRSLDWEVVTPCRTRGRWRLGPVEVTTSDPLGLFPVSRVVELGTTVLTLPRWVVLTQLAFALDGALPGELRSAGRSEAPPSIAGIRDYQVGDAMSRVHWAASAREGRLVTKQFEPEASTTLWLALDLDVEETGEGAKTLLEAVEELLVTATTSVGMYALQQTRLRVGLVTSGAFPATLMPERGRGQVQRMQELLAEAHPGGRARLVERLAGLDRRIAAQHILMLVTAREPRAWAERIELLRRRGVAVRVIQVETDGRVGAGRGAGGADGMNWAAPSVTLPQALNDPLRQDELIASLEGVESRAGDMAPRATA